LPLCIKSPLCSSASLSLCSKFFSVFARHSPVPR
jgi:hypothetical protein